MGLFGGLGGLFGGGGGSSFDGGGGIGNSSSTSDPTAITSNLSGGAESTNSATIVNGSNNTLLDAGAINGSLKLAMAGIESANSLAAQAQAAAGSVLTGSLTMAGEQQNKFTSALENIKTSDVRTLIVTGMVVVGVVAAAMLWKRG